MDTENTEAKRTGTWIPFYCWLIGIIVEAGLIYMLPACQRGYFWENTISFLLAVLTIFLFFICPVWMIVSSIRYWRTKNYAHSIIGALLALAIAWVALYGPMLTC